MAKGVLGSESLAEGVLESETLAEEVLGSESLAESGPEVRVRSSRFVSLGFQELFLPLDDLQSRDGRADLVSGSTVET